MSNGSFSYHYAANTLRNLFHALMTAKEVDPHDIEASDVYWSISKEVTSFEKGVIEWEVWVPFVMNGMILAGKITDWSIILVISLLTAIRTNGKTYYNLHSNGPCSIMIINSCVCERLAKFLMKRELIIVCPYPRLISLFHGHVWSIEQSVETAHDLFANIHENLTNSKLLYLLVIDDKKLIIIEHVIHVLRRNYWFMREN